MFGVSVTYPEGWSIKQAMRWGKDNRENTVFFQPPDGSAAIPSMYYQKYLEGAPSTADDAEAKLREQAAKKEASRQASGAADYQNDPSSFVFREIDGHPTLSYFATFTQNNEVQGEYFTRVLGSQGYVMFFVRGPAKDVQASIAAVSQMAGMVRPRGLSFGAAQNGVRSRPATHVTRLNFSGFLRDIGTSAPSFG